MPPSRNSMRVIGARLASLILALACSDEVVGVRWKAPVIVSSAVATNPGNALSALVAVTVRDADSVAVRFRLEEGNAASDSLTPAVRAVGSTVTIPVLGLLPARPYTMRAVAYGRGGTVTSDALTLVTGPLPQDLPQYATEGSDPTPGFVVFGAGRYGLAIDNTGRVVWYHRFANGPGLSFMTQPTGRYVTRPTTPEAGDLEPFVEIDVMGSVTRTFGCARDLQPRMHDLVGEPDGGYWIMCDETREMDLTAFGGVANARVTGTVVQHVSASGTVLFDWSPFDHLDLSDVDPLELRMPTVNWTHGNSLDVDAAGDLVVSFRSLGEITKIDGGTGAVIWRLGGRRNQFAFSGTSMPAFSRQHSVRLHSSGALLLMDNLGDPAQSRAERYAVNATSRIAQLDFSAAPGAGIVTQIGGSVQELPRGRTLVSFGTAGRVEEYDAAGRVVWRIAGNPGYVFRAQRVASLYAPGVGTSR